MTPAIRFTAKLQFRRGDKGRKHLDVAPPQPSVVPPGRVPRVSRMMALAIRFDGLIRSGAVADQADLARLGHVTRARVTQIMNLLQLAPDIQEALLHLPLIERGVEPLLERQLRKLAAVLDWRKQRRMWAEIHARESGCGRSDS